MIRERGSRTTALEHNVMDPLCVHADPRYLDDSVACEACGVRLAAEQAAANFNMRELGS